MNDVQQQLNSLQNRIAYLEHNQVRYSMPWDVRDNICRAVIQQTNGDMLTFRFLGKQFNLQVTNVVNMVDGATVTLDAAQGSEFVLTAAGNRTIAAPLHAVDGQYIIIRHVASGANRTLTLATGAAGDFRFNSTITGLTATTSGLTDYIGCLYNASDARWDVLLYIKGA